VEAQYCKQKKLEKDTEIDIEMLRRKEKADIAER
jgi:hypothetical protein